jgi:glycine cleavage system H lipoate-binding protein
MESFKYVDIFATKGLEYLVAIGFLITLVMFWRFLNRSFAATTSEIAEKIRTSFVDWFYLADDYYYHQGHSWMVPENKDVFRVGMDDFAQKLIGLPAKIELPRIGSKVNQGENGWRLQFNGKSIDMLSPVNGEVVAVNEEIIQNPAILNDDPYQKGWLLKVKPSRWRIDRRNLLSGSLARAWIEYSVNKLSARMTGDFGVVLQDGGLPVTGFAREISPQNWDQLAREFLLTEEMN